MSTGVIPSQTFPVRTSPLNGNETLIRQNNVNDTSDNPKEQMIPVSLILDYVNTNLNITSDADLTVIENNIAPPNTLPNNVFYKNSVTGDFFVKDKNGVLHDINKEISAISGIVNGNFLTITKSDNTSFNIDISSLLPDGNDFIINATKSAQDIITFSNSNGSSFTLDLSQMNYKKEDVITDLSLINDVLIYTKEDGNQQSYNLSEYKNQSRIENGQYVNGELILTRGDSTTIIIPLPISNNGSETLTSLTTSGSNLVYRDENENDNIIPIPSSGGEVVKIQNQFLTKSSMADVSSIYSNNGVHRTTLTNGNSLNYLRINGDNTNLSNTNTVIIEILFSPNTNGTNSLNSTISSFMPPTSIIVYDRSIDSLDGDDNSNANSSTAYTYNQGNVAKNKIITNVNNNILTIIVENMNSFAAWSIAMGW